MILSWDELGNPGENSSEWTYDGEPSEWTFYGEPGVLPQFGIHHDSVGAFYYALTEFTRDMEREGWFFRQREMLRPGSSAP